MSPPWLPFGYFLACSPGTGSPPVLATALKITPLARLESGCSPVSDLFP